MIDSFIQVVRAIVVVIVLIVWTILGFFLWIPLLTRTVAYFSGMIAIASFTRNTDMEAAQQRLNYAIEFYIYGYRIILGFLGERMSRQSTLESITPLDPIALLRSIAVDIVWTLMFWGSPVAAWLWRFELF